MYLSLYLVCVTVHVNFADTIAYHNFSDFSTCWARRDEILTPFGWNTLRRWNPLTRMKLNPPTASRDLIRTKGGFHHQRWFHPPERVDLVEKNGNRITITVLFWWTLTDSNRWPFARQANALPAELSVYLSWIFRSFPFSRAYYIWTPRECQA